jgi:4a-hydroxytetrahydrobiopterin dehydratase
MSDLTRKRCVPCEGGIAPLTTEQLPAWLEQLPKWSLSAEGKRIQRSWRMPHFAAAIAFCNQVAALAEAEGHHPDLHLTSYRQLMIEIWTHAVNGLTENDFILGAKIDALEVPPR